MPFIVRRSSYGDYYKKMLIIQKSCLIVTVYDKGASFVNSNDYPTGRGKKYKEIEQSEEKINIRNLGIRLTDLELWPRTGNPKGYLPKRNMGVKRS